MLADLLEILKKGKNKILYKINHEVLTYEEGYRRVLKLSINLKKQGNSPVIIYGNKNIDGFISVLSCIVAKRCYIPISLCTPNSRIKDIIKSTKSTLLLKNEEININNIECLTVNSLNSKYKNSIEQYNSNNNNAYIIFTSGSTGNSKGVPITYDNLNHFIKWIIHLNEFQNCNNLNVLSQANFSFDLSVMDIYFSIYKNCSIIAIDDNMKENLSKIYNVISFEKINFLIMTPTFIKLLMLDNQFNGANFSSIKYMFFCGECLEVTTVQKLRNRFPKVVIINAYGPTEATCCVSLTEITNDMFKNEILPIGKVDTSAVNIDIINEEICLEGESVFNGYIEENMISCFSNKYYRTGDLGKIINNFLYCSGRIDSQIKYQGYRIELGDIENNLLKIDGIREAAVIVKYKPNTKIVKLVKAFVVLDIKMNENKIKEKLAKLVPSYMIPKTIIILSQIPVNKNGKYDRKKLGEL